MPTDEQRMREQFEEFLATWFDEYDRALLTPKRLSRLKAAFEAGYLSRDAEVQALREALEKIAWLDTGENSSHADAMSALLTVELIAHAALAGGETGEAE